MFGGDTGADLSTATSSHLSPVDKQLAFMLLLTSYQKADRMIIAQVYAPSLALTPLQVWRDEAAASFPQKSIEPVNGY